MTSTILITGSSSGIGKATAKLFLEKGWNVAATMRHPKAEKELVVTDKMMMTALDVTDDASITKAVAEVISRFGKIDVLVNNAGYGLWGPFEAATAEQLKRQFDTNVLGLMAVTRAVLPHLRANGSGVIVNIASMGGKITFPMVSAYHGTKFAVEGFSESLSFELGDIGIRVKIIEPGVIDTEFQGRSLDWAQRDGLSDYDNTIAKFNKAMETMNQSSSPPSLVAEVNYTAVTDDSAQLRYPVGPDALALLEQRNAAGDEAFVAGIRTQLLGG